MIGVAFTDASVEQKLRSGRPLVKVGGIDATPCPRCRVPAGAACRRKRAEDGPHDARIAVMPPEAWVAEGDLVLLRRGTTEVVAELVEIRRGVVLTRRWLDAGGRWAAEKEVPLRNVRGPAPAEDERTKRAEARKGDGIR